MIEEINNFLGSFLDNADQVALLEATIDDLPGYLSPELLVLLAGFCEIGDIMPQLPSIFEIDQKLGDIGVWAFQSIAAYLS